MNDLRRCVVAVSDVHKRYGTVEAVRGVSLEVFEGEIVTLLGPSGCGKSTVLRIVAGFEHPSAGSIAIDGREMRGVPPNRRPVNLVFQRPALFPHLDVFDNIAFGLRLKRCGPEERRRRVRRMLEIVSLAEYADRWTDQLSGGEAQRIALARALVNEPSVLLLDEPLSALDLKIRQQMQAELKRIHHELGTTFLHVTHDQEEAMTLSDRIVLMNHGTILQVGTPEDIYCRPQTVFCAQFIGDTNLFPATVATAGSNGTDLVAGGVRIVGPAGSYQAKESVTVSLRPESIRISSGDDAPNRVTGHVTDVVFVGDRVRFHVRTEAGLEFVCQQHRADNTTSARPEDRVTLTWPAEATVILRE